MRILEFTLVLFSIVLVQSVSGQSVDEILDNYYEATGGRDAWNALEGMKFTGKVSQGGMDIPIEMVQTKSGKTYTKASFQGLNLMQNVYDGENLWSTNFATMKPEKATSEDLENHKLDINDFPDALINYKDLDYTAELIGTETFDGTDAYKIKLTKEPKKVDGEEVEDITFYYFETESGAMIGQESKMTSGPAKGSVMQIKLSDYQEVDGLYIPFSMSQGTKDGPAQPIVIESVELNPEIDETLLQFPSEEGESEEEK